MASVTVTRMPEEQRTFTHKEAAAYLGISTRYLSRETAGGQLPVVKIGRRVSYLRADLDAYIAAHRRIVGGTTEQDTLSGGDTAN